MIEYISKSRVKDYIHATNSTHGFTSYEDYTWLMKAVINTPAANVQPVNHWISVKDKLPNEGERVLIYAPRTQNRYYIATFYMLRDEIKFTMNIYGLSYCWYADDVTHWLPLPETPKDGDTNE